MSKALEHIVPLLAQIDAPMTPSRNTLADCAAYHERECKKHERSDAACVENGDACTARYYRAMAAMHAGFAVACREADGE